MLLLRKPSFLMLGCRTSMLVSDQRHSFMEDRQRSPPPRMRACSILWRIYAPQAGWAELGKLVSLYITKIRLRTLKRTLQEGVLSSRCLFQTRGSLAYLRLLYPNHDRGLNLSWSYCKKRLQRPLRRLDSAETTQATPDVTDCEQEPLYSSLRDLFFELVKDSLDVEQRSNYARGLVREYEGKRLIS